MQLELRFFASFRQAVGQKTLERAYDADAVAVAEVLEDLVDAYPDLEVFERPGELRSFVSVMKNGRDVTHLDGLETDLEDGDRLSLFPPVAGG